MLETLILAFIGLGAFAGVLAIAAAIELMLHQSHSYRAFLRRLSE